MKIVGIFFVFRNIYLYDFIYMLKNQKKKILFQSAIILVCTEVLFLPLNKYDTIQIKPYERFNKNPISFITDFCI